MIKAHQVRLFLFFLATSINIYIYPMYAALKERNSVQIFWLFN